MLSISITVAFITPNNKQQGLIGSVGEWGNPVTYEVG